MKKKNSALFLICGVLLLLFALAGCTPAEQGSGETTGQKTQGSTEQTTESEITTAERAQTTESGITTEETTEAEIEEIIEKNYGLANDLILELIDYLRMNSVYHDMTETSTAIKINQIKEGGRGLMVTFDPSTYYFACAYYNGSHEEEIYCCAESYTWVKYENASDIQEYYNGEKIVKAFQVNQSLSCENIVSQANDSTAQHFQLFETVFQNGFNSTSPQAYDNTFVFITSSHKETVYCSDSAYDHEYVSFPCAKHDGAWHILILLSTNFTNGSSLEADLKVEFGEYYDDLMNIMITGQYSETYENGTVSYFGLFKIEDIAKIVLK